MYLRYRTGSAERTTRRSFLQRAVGAVAVGPLAAIRALAKEPGQTDEPFRLRYILASCMYGKMPLATILPEVERTGSEALDVWGLVHGNQREQIDEMGLDRFEALLKESGVELGALTRYPLGPFGLRDEMRVAKRLGAKVIVCGAAGPSEPSGEAAREGVEAFLEKMKPHAALAEELGVTIALENHSRQVLYTPDSLRYFAELNRSKHLGIAFAPHHLHKFAAEIPALIRDLGRHVRFFYAQEHGKGMHEKLPKHEEMLQMPGYGGGLDYVPIVRALRAIDYRGWVEIFMHPVPRGIPILSTAAEVTKAILKSRAYLEKCRESAT